MIDFTDSANPVEIAYCDRGPIDPESLILGGVWSAYWYDGKIYATEIVRGLDVLSLVPSEYLTENEIAAAVVADQSALFNPQQQFRIDWPATPIVAQAYIDQFQRGGELATSFIDDLNMAMEDALIELQDGGPDEELAIRLESLAAGLKTENLATSVLRTRMGALAETLSGIAARLR